METIEIFKELKTLKTLSDKDFIIKFKKLLYQYWYIHRFPDYAPSEFYFALKEKYTFPNWMFVYSFSMKWIWDFADKKLYELGLIDYEPDCNP